MYMQVDLVLIGGGRSLLVVGLKVSLYPIDPSAQSKPQIAILSHQNSTTTL